MKKLYITAILLGLTTQAQAEQVFATVYQLTADGQGKNIGTISFTDTTDGLFITEKFSNLSAGLHGIHVHEHGNCESTFIDGKAVLGGGAGGHYDPQKTGQHLGPNADGHKGDLPVLMVKSDGTVENSFYLKNVTTADFKGRSVIIHEGSDNYKDEPKPLGGGGNRIACGVIK